MLNCTLFLICGMRRDAGRLFAARFALFCVGVSAELFRTLGAWVQMIVVTGFNVVHRFFVIRSVMHRRVQVALRFGPAGFPAPHLPVCVEL